MSYNLAANHTIQTHRGAIKPGGAEKSKRKRK